MHRYIFILIGLLLLTVSARADDRLPIIEVKADRTMIYPQRMELTGEESLMDILQIGMQLVYYTKNVPIRKTNGTPAYGCLSVSKQFGKRWNMGIDWHDMFEAFCDDIVINRHAANIKLQYRF